MLRSRYPTVRKIQSARYVTIGGIFRATVICTVTETLVVWSAEVFVFFRPRHGIEISDGSAELIQEWRSEVGFEWGNVKRFDAVDVNPGFCVIRPCGCPPVLVRSNGPTERITTDEVKVLIRSVYGYPTEHEELMILDRLSKLVMPSFLAVRADVMALFSADSVLARRWVRHFSQHLPSKAIAYRRVRSHRGLIH